MSESTKKMVLATVSLIVGVAGGLYVWNSVSKKTLNPWK